MSRFKLTIALTLLSCLFLLACATTVSANTSVLTTSTSAQPRLQQMALQKLTSNPNFQIENLQVIVDGDTVELKGITETGFQRALAQKFLEHSQGVMQIKNNLKVSKLNHSSL
ncbi:BON domain-containing protein [Pseudoalteromonas shioyasakiensis]|uniref:BON domain-containing protein n=1 Tax=Pseudoalteromonas TaxID=53246 RepID=UPI000C96D21C|nr:MULTISPECIES: BON domain-containing protein [Pseudoalteromonas]MAD05426.1 BON domain-containing protein [Pseudoalteromonas sp.]MCG9707332.1 BON domain-containing protein [Pseudoalteromonas sp. Isolate3]MCQ8880952.1 BON domain-containing protein [Pseudoalteromonas shioyasakiensis]NIZ06880.1 BON domain-containing protein [Pseudoalteromonas sp. HF66]QLE10154.1 BON domain-containing protein [Pseudoalteromonas shioyasakiensis]|tara:strand:+ start:8623 stop:8961 length:339 start_codon:yes stop_codon:yes gene_type:complete